MSHGSPSKSVISAGGSPKSKNDDNSSVNSLDVEDDRDENGKLKPKGQQPNKNSKFAIKKKKVEVKKKDDFLTQRGAVLKLELGGVIADGQRTKEMVHHQMETVATHIYNMKEFPTQKTSDSNQWYATDKILFEEAKASYDNVMNCFEDDPRTYKFESTKEKIWDYNTKALKLRPRKKKEDPVDEKKPVVKVKKTKPLGKKAKKDDEEEENNLESASYKPLSLEEQIGTHIDPYQVPKPWRVEVKGKSISYYNEETRDRVYTKPAEIWADKLYLLEHLTPRDDLDGYEYKETDAEKRKRLRVKTDYDGKMNAEIQRRIHNPTDMEIIEDCLFDIVETIAIQREREEKLFKNKEKRKERARWNILCSGYPMKPLGRIESEDGEVEVLVSDHEFVDMIITPTGMCVPEIIPSKVYVIHEKEREDARKRKAIEDELELMERKKPIKDKIGDVLDLARTDTGLAKMKLIEIIKKDTNYYIQKLRSIDRKLIAGVLKQQATHAKDSLVKFSKDPIGNIKHSIEVMNDLYQSITGAKKDNPFVDLDALMNEMEGVKIEEAKEIVESDEDRFERLCKASRLIQIKHADRILVKMTLLCEVPPPFLRRPAPGWEDDVRAAQTKLDELLQKTKYEVETKIIEPILDEDGENPHIQAIKDAIQVMKKAGNENFQKFKKLLPLPPIKSKITNEDGGDYVDENDANAREALLNMARASGEFKDLEADAPISPEKSLKKSSALVGAGKLNLLNDTLKNNSNDSMNLLAVEDTAAGSSMDNTTFTEMMLAESTDNLDTGKTSTALAPLKKKKKKKKLDERPGYLKATHAKYGKFNYNLLEKLAPISEKINEIYEEVAPDTIKEGIDTLKDSIQKLKDSMPDLKGSLRDAINALPGGELILERFPKLFSENIDFDDIGQDEGVKLIFDTSFRKQFEDQLLRDLSRSVCLPMSNISIEEIQPLPPNHWSIIELSNKRLKLIEKFDEANKEKQKLLDRDMAYRTALAMGTVNDFLKQEEIVRLTTAGFTVDGNGVPLPLHGDTAFVPNDTFIFNNVSEMSGAVDENGNSINNTNVLALTMDSLNALATTASGSEGKIPISSRSGKSHSSDSKNSNNSHAPEDPKPPIESEIVKLMDYIIKRTEYVDRNPFSSSIINLGIPDSAEIYDFMEFVLLKVEEKANEESKLVASEEPVPLTTTEKTDQTADGTISDVNFAYKSEQLDPNDDFLRLTKATTIVDHIPGGAQFKIGIVNMDDLKFDKNYWLAKQLRQRTDDELRAVRIKRLKLSVKEKSLEEKLQDLKKKKEELIEDAKEALDSINIYYDPAIEDYEKFDQKYLDPIREDMKPHIDKAKDYIEPYRKEAEKHFNVGKKIVLSRMEILAKFTKRRLEEFIIKNKMLHVLKGLPIVQKIGLDLSTPRFLEYERETAVTVTSTVGGYSLSDVAATENVNIVDAAGAVDAADAVDAVGIENEFTYDILYDDGEAEAGVSEDLIRLKVIKKYLLGDIIEGNYNGSGSWYPGKISNVHEDDTYDIDYDDGEEEGHITGDLIRLQVQGATDSPALVATGIVETNSSTTKEFNVGDKVEGNYAGNGTWYSGKIVRVNIITKVAEPGKGLSLLDSNENVGHPTEVADLMEDICNTIQNEFDRQQAAIKLENIQKLKEQEANVDKQMEDLQRQIENLSTASIVPLDEAVDDHNESIDGNAEGGTEKNSPDISRPQTAEDGVENSEENAPVTVSASGDAEIEAEKNSGSGIGEAAPEEELDEVGGDDWFEKRRVYYIKDRDYDAGVVNTIHLISLSLDMALGDGVDPPEVYADLNDFYNDDRDNKTYRTKLEKVLAYVPTAEEEEAAAARAKTPGLEGKHDSTAENIDEDKPEPLVGCVVHFMIYVNDEQRKIDGLEDIEAEDIGVMLMEQFTDQASSLRSGTLTQHILDVSYKNAAKKRPFEAWESFWVNIIHPAFFGYVSHNQKKPPKPPENEYSQLGIKITNPIAYLPERQKMTWTSLEKKGIRKPTIKAAKETPKVVNKKLKGLDDDDEEEEKRREDLKKKEEKKEKPKSLLDLGEEDVGADFAVDSMGNKKAVIYRPNMGALTKKDIMKCMRVWQATEDTYAAEMRRGLVDGQRLSKAQYISLKERDQALRIYTIAKQKFSRDNKGAGEFDIPPPEITKVSPELYNEWIMEAREEEERHLRQERKKASMARELRQQEAEISKAFGAKKSWFQGKIVKLCHYSADMGAGIKEIQDNDELIENKMKMKVLSEDETKVFNEKWRIEKEILIQEEKHTRQIFEFILAWSKRAVRRKNIVGLGLFAIKAPPADGSSGELKEIEDGNDDGSPGKRAKTPKLIKDGPNEEQLVELDKEAFMNASKLPSASRELVLEFVDNCNKMLEVERTKAKLDDYKGKLAKVILEHEKRVKSLEDSLRMGGGNAKKVPTLINEDIPKIQKLIEEVEVAYELSQEKLAQVQQYKLLVEEELTVCRETKWLETVAKYAEFFEALKEFPTYEPDVFAREDLVMFATFCCTYEPMYTDTIKGILDKREKMAAAAALRKKKEVKVESEEEKQARFEKEMLEVEEKRRAEKVLEAAERRKKREKAWLRAHPHIFVSIPGEYAFCVECKEREYDAWKEEFMTEEKAWIDSFDAIVTDMLSEFKNDLREKIAEEYRILERQRRLKGKLQYQAHLQVYKKEIAALISRGMNMDMEKFQRKVRDIMTRLPKIEKVNDCIEFPPHLPLTRKKDMGKMALNYKKYLISLNSFIRGEDEDEINRKCFIPEYVLRSGLSFVDWKGRRIVPPVLDIVIDPRTVPLEIDGNESDIDPDELRIYKSNPDNPDKTYPITGIKLRVWHRELDGSRGTFMGQVKLNHQEMMEPAKGIRTYPLTSDPRCNRESTKVEVTGSIAVIVKSTKLNKRTNQPMSWRVEVCRCTNLATVVDDIDRSTPYVEVLWRGIGERAAFNSTLKQWMQVGVTKHKEKQLDPVFEKWDNNTYELPPLWTDLPIPGRGFGGEAYYGGGWVGKNCVPSLEPEDPDAVKKAEQQAKKEAAFAMVRKKSFTPRKMLKSAIATVMACSILDLKPRHMIDAEEKVRIETFKFLREQEENERLAMAFEDIEVRRNIVAWEINRSAPYLEQQVIFSREFSKLMRFIKNPPPILSRLRFMMGEQMGGGGLRMMVQDPTTQKFLNLMAVPIMYPEDEEQLVMQLNALIGKQNPHLLKIIDYSVHMIRFYNSTGFAAVDERSALIMCDRYEGPEVLEYLNSRWDKVSNDDFRDILIQIVQGLADLHQEGILHRNLGERAFCVEVPKKVTIQTSDFNAKSQLKDSKRLLSDRPNVRVGEYLFLHNPRKQGCAYSNGRADWGDLTTRPPEAVGGHILSDVSDMYAFGVCVYRWLTRGLNLPDGMNQGMIEGLHTSIPLKWGSWVHSLLRMCLQENPKNRATAKEILLFLQNRLNKNKLNR